MAHFPTSDGRAPWAATVLTLFPEMFPGALGVSLVGQALSAGIWSLDTVRLRDFGVGRHASVDDHPAGGGAGMVLRADVVAAAIDHVRAARDDRPAIYLSPRGEPLTQALVRDLAAGPGVMLLAGRFEGVDERVIEGRRLREISIGDYVLSGGEIAAQVLIDACVRLLPGVLGGADFDRRGELRQRAARIPAVHQAARVGGADHSGSAAVRRPQEDRGLAQGRSRADHARATPGSDGQAEVGCLPEACLAGARHPASIRCPILPCRQLSHHAGAYIGDEPEPGLTRAAGFVRYLTDPDGGNAL